MFSINFEFCTTFSQVFPQIDPVIDIKSKKKVEIKSHLPLKFNFLLRMKWILWWTCDKILRKKTYENLCSYAKLKSPTPTMKIFFFFNIIFALLHSFLSSTFMFHKSLLYICQLILNIHFLESNIQIEFTFKPSKAYLKKMKFKIINFLSLYLCVITSLHIKSKDEEEKI